MVRTFDCRDWIGFATLCGLAFAGLPCSGAELESAELVSPETGVSPDTEVSPETSAPPATGADEAAAARRVMAAAINGARDREKATAEPAVDAAPQAAPAATVVPPDLVIAKLSAEVAAKQLEAKRIAQKSPAEAMAILDTIASRVAGETIPADARSQLERRIERTRRDIEETTGKRRAEIALDRKNTNVEAQIDRERAKRVEVDERLAMLVEEYNVLVDERRFQEAEAIAKKAAQLSPDSTIVRQLLSQSRVVRRLSAQQSIDGNKQAAFLEDTEDTDRASTAFVGPIAFPETKNWTDLTKNRSRLEAEGRSRASAAEIEIQKKLSVKVRAAHRNADALARLRQGYHLGGQLLTRGQVHAR
jgi:general secretion pathway protein D